MARGCGPHMGWSGLKARKHLHRLARQTSQQSIARGEGGPGGGNRFAPGVVDRAGRAAPFGVRGCSATSSATDGSSATSAGASGGGRAAAAGSRLRLGPWPLGLASTRVCVGAGVLGGAGPAWLRVGSRTLGATRWGLRVDRRPLAGSVGIE
jgi:hypothetical protein